MTVGVTEVADKARRLPYCELGSALIVIAPIPLYGELPMRTFARPDVLATQTPESLEDHRSEP